jgi:sensor histidine kinase YesM
VDTGIGVTESAHQPKLGLGLSNVQQRLQRYGSAVKPLLIRSTPGGGTTVEIAVPIQARELNVVDAVKSS